MSDPLERPHFFSGRLLKAEDLGQEQEFVREKLRRHNSSLHGFGIVSGLEVTVDSGKIVVSEGLALDCLGNEVLLEAPQVLLPTADSEAWRSAYVNTRYNEVSVPEASETPCNLKESCEIGLAQENCNRGHRHVHARWLACGQAHALTLAKLRRSPHGWRVDRRYRPPTVK